MGQVFVSFKDSFNVENWGNYPLFKSISNDNDHTLILFKFDLIEPLEQVKKVQIKLKFMLYRLCSKNYYLIQLLLWFVCFIIISTYTYVSFMSCFCAYVYMHVYIFSATDFFLLMLCCFEISSCVSHELVYFNIKKYYFSFISSIDQYLGHFYY